MRKYIRFILSALLVVCLLTTAAFPGRAVGQTGLEGKTLSILGDSISTYELVSNNVAYNYTLANNRVFYTAGVMGVYQQDTWWQQTVDALGMELLVNNSWSGSCMFMDGAGTPGAYKERCVQLHDQKGRQPDLIAIYLGTNDQDYFPDTLGTYREIDFEKLIVPEGEGYAYAEATTCLEAYAIALHKIQQRYPNAEIYCFNLLQRPGFTPYSLIDFNADLSRLARHFGVYVVELRGCGITSANAEHYLGDYVHPNALGMDAISDTFISTIMDNSRYVTGAIQPQED